MHSGGRHYVMALIAKKPREDRERRLVIFNHQEVM